ncbi:MAG: cation-translocating P-type ATPase [Phycisphaeraceae bacterium]|nr:cation-translocating P-type ATPase [Phycisphaeraceae bacterium]
MTDTALATADDEPAGLAGRLFSPRGELVSSLAAGALLLTSWLLKAVGAGEIAAVLVWASLAIGMVHGVRAAWDSLRGGAFDIDCLMVIGAALAAYIGAPAEGALLLFLFVLAGALEGLAMARTKRAVEALHKLMPTEAVRWSDSTNQWESAPPEALAAGDRIKIMPGELVPADASVLAGDSAMDQASLTGESMPRNVGVGDDLYAGTVNVGNSLEARVTRPASESSLQRVLNLVLQAQQQREPVQRLIDRVSQPYAIGVMVASAAVLLVWWQVFKVPLVVQESGGVGGSLYTAITLLVVMSPCAVIIATPTATLAAIARAARGGVLFKGGQAIERLARMRALAMDKTGTLTVGHAEVHEMKGIGWSDTERLLAVAAGLEQDSTHPIAAAIRAAAAARGIKPMRATRTTFEPGRGVSGVFDGHPARLGTIEHTQKLVPVCLRAKLKEFSEAARGRGHIATIIAWNGQAGVVVIHDELRPGADQVVGRLHAMGIGPVVMLTGDNARTAENLAKAVGIDRWRAELMPDGKVEQIRALKAEVRSVGSGRGGVGLVGDGVNDAPALAAADVSLAVGSIGSDAALESADVVLMGDDLAALPWAVDIARRARRTIAANLTFALVAICAMAVATLVGSRLGFALPLWMGVIGHEGGTLLVVANSLLLLTVPKMIPSEKRPVSLNSHAVDPAHGGEATPAGGALQPVTSLK